MTESEAIIARHSVRQYLDKPIEAEKIEAIQECIDHCNREGGVHIQLIANEIRRRKPSRMWPRTGLPPAVFPTGLCAG